MKFLVKFTPKAAPIIWIFINIAIVLCSVALLCILAFTGEDSKYDDFARDWYLTYNIVTSIIWLSETSLRMINEAYVPVLSHENSNTMLRGCWYHRTTYEWILAGYFVIDSILMVWKRHKGQDHTDHMGLVVAICVVAYMYAFWVTYTDSRTRQQGYAPVGGGDENPRKFTFGIPIQVPPTIQQNSYQMTV
jgi:hypothetical protein